MDKIKSENWQINTEILEKCNEIANIISSISADQISKFFDTITANNYKKAEIMMIPVFIMSFLLAGKSFAIAKGWKELNFNVSSEEIMDQIVSQAKMALSVFEKEFKNEFQRSN